MKNNSKKHVGFGLIEIVISMMILAIISTGVYVGYMIIIKQTKAGQVKQLAALEGKKVIEELQDNSFGVTDIEQSTLDIGDITLTKQSTTGSAIFYRYLNENYGDKDEANNDITVTTAKYIEKITLTPTKTDEENNIVINGEQITDELEKSSNINYKVYIGKEKNSGGTAIEDYIKDKTKDSPLELYSNKIKMYVYFEIPSSSKNDRTITIKDFNGTNLLETTEPLKDITPLNPSKVNLCINFNDYKQITSVPELENSNLKDVEIYAYNKTGKVANIYLQKDISVTADVKVCKGEINIHDNRAEDAQEENMGTLYDIKLEIIKDNDNLFTGYYKKNIHQ